MKVGKQEGTASEKKKNKKSMPGGSGKGKRPGSKRTKESQAGKSWHLK